MSSPFGQNVGLGTGLRTGRHAAPEICAVRYQDDPSHAVIVLRSEKRILEDVRRQLVADTHAEGRDDLLKANWRELRDVRDALVMLSGGQP